MYVHREICKGKEMLTRRRCFFFFFFTRRVMIYDNPCTLICFIPAFYEASGISLGVQRGTSRLRDIATEYIWAMPQILCIYDACRGSSFARQNDATYVRSPGENANYIN